MNGRSNWHWSAIQWSPVLRMQYSVGSGAGSSAAQALYVTGVLELIHIRAPCMFEPAVHARSARLMFHTNNQRWLLVYVVKHHLLSRAAYSEQCG